jgi:hypothetical protein
MIFAIDDLDAAELDLDEVQQGRDGSAAESHGCLLNFLAPPTG